ncbi:unnamed protein product [Periconia digitata]|uniref:Uncharacterized protein n=1 Tax=Periconia digitata TaxID=1303443 RepID=A0A9W4UVN1_9PLEO|nr:unnamed protein product [Periconia digitata]
MDGWMDGVLRLGWPELKRTKERKGETSGGRAHVHNFFFALLSRLAVGGRHRLSTLYILFPPPLIRMSCITHRLITNRDLFAHSIPIPLRIVLFRLACSKSAEGCLLVHVMVCALHSTRATWAKRTSYNQ